MIEKYDLVVGAFVANSLGRIELVRQIGRRMSSQQIYCVISSRKVYSNGLGLTEYSQLNSCPDRYTRLKLKEENLVRKYFKKYIIARIPNFLSPDIDLDDKKFFSVFVNNYWNFDKVVIEGGPRSVKDFLCYTDLEFSLAQLARSGFDGVVNIGYGIPILLNDFVMRCIGKWGAVPVVYEAKDSEEFWLDAGLLHRQHGLQLFRDRFEGSFCRVLTEIQGVFR